MSAQTVVRPVATPEEQAVLHELMAEPEAAISDAPLYSPQSAGLLLLGLLLSPEVPKEPKDK
ncbi:hypothetical protein [Saccharothrix coeruleofusca]|uniref:Uncharacterized protein n=1 Tax=Saccharothrix coeruleofusca TaxID=33919 RepID=A0A918AP05_9PSEU|nr:hypothetical protein [Saccharothrix coeruleofusca]MBP2337594.1 hypothetical protein [Saccharothrix coeruleofusca]GGP64774.1 hypothetical protein GCM10010185_41680 [Saccharothrix coeruleofusca]